MFRTTRRVLATLLSWRVLPFLLLAGLALALPEHWSTTASAWLGRTAEEWLGAGPAESETPPVDRELARLRQHLILKEQEVRALRSQLQELSALPPESGLVTNQLLPVRVLRGVDRSSPYRRLVIDAGADQGLAVGMPVLAGASLLGRISRVGPTEASVVLLSDPTSRVRCRLDPAGSEGRLIGTGQRRLHFIPATARLSEARTLVTSSRSLVFPGGLLIGTLEEALPRNEPGASPTFYVMPAAEEDRQWVWVRLHLPGGDAPPEDPPVAVGALVVPR